MLFSQPRTIGKINTYAIPLAIDKNRAGGRTDAERKLFPPNSGVRAYVLSPAGEILRVADISRVGDLVEALPQFAESTGTTIVAPQTVAPRIDRPASVPEGGVSLQLTGRLLQPRRGEVFRLPRNPAFRIPLNRNALPDPQHMFQQRFEAPTFEWMPVTRNEMQRLAPSGAKVGDTWKLDDELARSLLWRLRPPTHYPHPRITDVEKAEASATVTARDGERLTVRFEGTFRARHRWYPTASEGVWLGNIDRFAHWCEGAAEGELVVDIEGGRVLSFEIATRDAAYKGKDGTDMPYGAEAHLEPDKLVSGPPPH